MRASLKKVGNIVFNSEKSSKITAPNVTKTELQDVARRCLKFFNESKAGKLPGERIDAGSAFDVASISMKIEKNSTH